MSPVIIEAAINGATPKARNARVPIAPAEVAADALACLAAGAAIVHSHIDDYLLAGAAAAERYLAGWGPVLRQRPDAILYPTVSIFGRVEDRFAHVEALAVRGAARMGVLDPGSVNLGAGGDDGLPGGGGIDFVYQNTYGDIRWTVALLARLRLGPSIAVFEPGFLRTTLAYRRAGRLPAGAFVKLYFGGDGGYFGGPPGAATFGLPPTRAALDAYVDLLAGSDLPWAVAVVGGDVVRSGIAGLAIARGGHVRVGLEDRAGDGAPSNADLVAEVVALARAAGRSVATPTEAAGILGLPPPPAHQ